jgi:hypothetical protein
MPTKAASAVYLAPSGARWGVEPAKVEVEGSNPFARSSRHGPKLSPPFFRTAKKPNCRKHSRIELGGSVPERSGKTLSEWAFLSEAWGLADLLYKLFWPPFQEVSLVV